MSDIEDAQTVTVDAKDFIDMFEYMPEQANRACHELCYDVKERAPVWIAQVISRLYNVRQKDVKSGASVHISGRVGDDGVVLEYSGRVLTPIHYRMTPRAPSKNLYRLKVGNYKGSLKVVGVYTKKKKRGGPHSADSGWLLFPTTKGGSTYIPMRRTTPGHRGSVKAMRGPSIPSIVTSDYAAEQVEQKLTTEIEKRMQHHIDRWIK